MNVEKHRHIHRAMVTFSPQKEILVYKIVHKFSTLFFVGITLNDVFIKFLLSCCFQILQNNWSK